MTESLLERTIAWNRPPAPSPARVSRIGRDMNLKTKLFAAVAAAALAIGLGSGVSAQDDTKGLTVTVELDATLGVIDYYFVDSATPVNFGSASITGLDGETLAGTATDVTVYLVDARLSPDDDGFLLTVDIDDPFTSALPSQFPASAAELVTANAPTLTTTVTYPTSGSLTGVASSGLSGPLNSPGVAILEGANGSNVQLNQVLDLEVNVPADTPASTYTTTLILSGVDAEVP